MLGDDLTTLVVDDEIHWREVTKDAIKDAGFKVLEAQNPEEGLKLIDERSGNLSAVILDIMMDPGKAFSQEETRAGFETGIAVARRIREKYPQLPIIGFSSSGDKRVREWFLENRLYFVQKPDLETLVGTLRNVTSGTRQPKRLKIFIVHGHDEKTALELKNFLQNTLQLPEPVILREQPERGRTIIEKFEQVSQDVDIAFVLLTPDDKGYRVGASNEDKRSARQNVIFELGFFFGQIGRKRGRIILLYKGNLELPSDISGIIYVEISKGIEAAGVRIRRELEEWL